MHVSISICFLRHYCVSEFTLYVRYGDYDYFEMIIRSTDLDELWISHSREWNDGWWLYRLTVTESTTWIQTPIVDSEINLWNNSWESIVELFWNIVDTIESICYTISHQLRWTLVAIYLCQYSIWCWWKKFVETWMNIWKYFWLPG